MQRRHHITSIAVLGTSLPAHNSGPPGDSLGVRSLSHCSTHSSSRSRHSLHTMASRLGARIFAPALRRVAHRQALKTARRQFSSSTHGASNSSGSDTPWMVCLSIDQFDLSLTPPLLGWVCARVYPNGGSPNIGYVSHPPYLTLCSLDCIFVFAFCALRFA